MNHQSENSNINNQTFPTNNNNNNGPPPPAVPGFGFPIPPMVNGMPIFPPGFMMNPGGNGAAPSGAG